MTFNTLLATTNQQYNPITTEFAVYSWWTFFYDERTLLCTGSNLFYDEITKQWQQTILFNITFPKAMWHTAKTCLSTGNYVSYLSTGELFLKTPCSRTDNKVSLKTGNKVS